MWIFFQRCRRQHGKRDETHRTKNKNNHRSFTQGSDLYDRSIGYRIQPSTLYLWVKTGKTTNKKPYVDFADRVITAEAQGALKALEIIQDSIQTREMSNRRCGCSPVGIITNLMQLTLSQAQRSPQLTPLSIIARC